MSDIVMKLKEAACPPNTGCMTFKDCVCDVMEDAADEIERLQDVIMGQDASIIKLGEEVGRLQGIIHAMSSLPTDSLEG
jgi:hypothetical protein